jgi:ABC-type lipoprotein release transport system permease subunit
LSPGNPLIMRIWIGFIFVLKDLLSEWRRTLMTVLSLTIIITGYLIPTALADAFATWGTQPVGSRNLVILAKGIIDPMESVISTEIYESLISKKPPGITAVSPVIYRHIRVNDRVVDLRAVPPQDWIPIYGLELAEGSLPNGNKQVMLTQGAQAALALNPGDPITIYGGSFVISGIVKASSLQFATIWMRLEDGQELFSEYDNYQAVYLQSSPEIDLETTRTACEQLPFLGHKYSVYLEDALYLEASRSSKDLLMVSRILVAIALFSIVFGSYNLTQLNLAEREHILSILRTIGYEAVTLASLKTAQSVLIGMTAFILASLLSYELLGWYQNGQILVFRGNILALTIQWNDLVLGFILVIVFTFIGAWIPTHLHANQPLAESLSVKRI